mgnify:FL=1
MTHRLLFLTLVIGFALALPALAQGDCGSSCGSAPTAEKKQGCGGSCGDKCGDSCEGACKADPNSPLSARVAKIEKAAAKGCETCGARMVALRDIFGADSDESVSELIATYESSAKGGCEASSECITKAEARLKASACKTTPLSDRVAALVQNSQNGCEKSGQKLAAFHESCGISCDKTIIAKLQGLETSAAKGCRKSTFKLAVLDARLAGKPDPKAPLSLRVAFMTEYAGKGCEVSSTTLKAIEADFDEAARKDLVAAIEVLETKAANGSQECVAKLAVIEAKLPAIQTAKKAKGSCNGEERGSDCEDCDDKDCGSKCEDRGGKDCESGCPSGAPAKADKAASGCGGCPSEKKQNA